MKTFKNLLIWQKAITLVTETYAYTNSFPKQEIFGLTSQPRRAAISIPSNISEGYGRSSNRDFFRFVAIARGSLFEFQTQIEIAKQLHYLDEQQFYSLNKKTQELEAMLNAFGKKLKESFKS